MRSLSAFALFALLSCGTKEAPPALAEEPLVRAPAPKDEPPEQSRETDAGLPAITGLPVGVPAFEEPMRTKTIAPKTRKIVGELNRKARSAAKAGEFGKAIELYKEALSHDPGHLLARYNLSCAYNRSGAPEEGMKLLKELKENGCEPCLGRLVRARVDSDWQSAARDPRFIEITGDARVADSDLAVFGASFAKAIADEDFTAIEPFFDSRRPTKIYFIDAYCEDAVGEGCARPKQFSSFKAMREHFGGLIGSWSQNDEGKPYHSKDVSCTESCCTILSNEPADSMCEDCISHIRVCLEADSGGVRALTQIRIIGT